MLVAVPGMNILAGFGEPASFAVRAWQSVINVKSVFIMFNLNLSKTKSFFNPTPTKTIDLYMAKSSVTNQEAASRRANSPVKTAATLIGAYTVIKFISISL